MGGRFPSPELLSLLDADLRTEPEYERVPAVGLGAVADPDRRCSQDCNMVLLVGGLLDSDREPIWRVCRTIRTVYQACATHGLLSETGRGRCVLSGDWLFTQAFKDALAERNMRLLHCLVGLAQVLVNSDLLEHLALLPREHDSVTSPGRADCTSAARFRLCAQIGVVAAGGDTEIENRLADCGAHLGRAWHLAEDLDEYYRFVQDPSADGMRKMRISSLFAYAVASSRDGAWCELSATLDGWPQFAAAFQAKAFAGLGALDWARNEIARESAACLRIASALPPSPYREALIDAGRLCCYAPSPAASPRSMSA